MMEMRDLDKENIRSKGYKKCNGCGCAIRKNQSECPKCKSKYFNMNFTKVELQRLNRHLNVRNAYQYGF